MSKRSPALSGILVFLLLGTAQAQFFGAAPQQNQIPENLDPAVCDSLAGVPNAPMTPEACRAMVGAAQSAKSAGSDPGAMRPGDENLTCDQINAEMRTVGTPLVSQETGAQARVAADAQMAMMQKQQAEQKAFVAGQMAAGVGIGALGLLPGGGYAAMAAQQAMMAQQQAFIEKQYQESAGVRAQTDRALTASTTELSQGLQSNPRFARLIDLSVQKNCPSPPDAVDPRR